MKKNYEWFKRFKELPEDLQEKFITKLATSDYFNIDKYNNTIVELDELSDEEFNKQLISIIEQTEWEVNHVKEL